MNIPSPIWAALSALVVFLVAQWILVEVHMPYATLVAFILAVATFFGYSRLRP